MDSDLEQKRMHIRDLDLGPILFKLVNEKGWSRQDAEMVVVLYRQFLFLNVKYPDRSIVPTEEVDEFWHQHILDTRKYAEDCNQIFGEMLHHFPYLGIRGGNDAEVLQTTFANTKEVWESEFNDKEGENFLNSGSLNQAFNLGDVLGRMKGANCDTCGSGSCAASSCGPTCSGVRADMMNTNGVDLSTRPSL